MTTHQCSTSDRTCFHHEAEVLTQSWGQDRRTRGCPLYILRYRVDQNSPDGSIRYFHGFNLLSQMGRFSSHCMSQISQWVLRPDDRNSHLYSSLPASVATTSCSSMLDLLSGHCSSSRSRVSALRGTHPPRAIVVLFHVRLERRFVILKVRSRHAMVYWALEWNSLSSRMVV